MEAQPEILLFDGVCNLCNSTVQFILKKDKKARFKFAALQSEAGRTQLKRLGLPENYFDSFVYIRGNVYYRKSTAVLHMLKDIGGAWGLLYGFIILPRFVRDFFYDIIAANRYKVFGKRESCIIPTPELKSRFLD